MQGTTHSQAVGLERGVLRPRFWDMPREALRGLLSQQNPENTHEVDRLCRNSCGDQKMLQTECFLTLLGGYNSNCSGIW